MRREVGPARERELGGEARAGELGARDDEGEDRGEEGGVGALADGREGRQRDEARRELDEGPERKGDEAGLLGRGRAQDGEEDRGERLEADEGGGRCVRREGREGEGRQGVVEGRVCVCASGASASRSNECEKGGGRGDEDAPSAKTPAVTCVARASMLPTSASTPVLHASRRPSLPLGARR